MTPMDLFFWVVEIAFLGAALKSRRWALMVVAFSLPLARRMPSLPVPLLNYENLVFLMALLSFAIHGSEAGEKGEAKGGRLRFAIPLTLLAILFTGSFLNTLITFTPRTFIRLWDPYANVMRYKALMVCLALYILGSLGVKTRDDLVAVFRAALSGMAFESAYTAFEYLVLRPGRVTGHLGEPNSMGAYLAAAFAVLFAAFLTLPRFTRYWWIAGAGAAGGVIGLLGTYSRSSYLCTAAAFVFLSALLDRRVLAAGLVALLLAPVWAPVGVRQRLESTFIEQKEENYRFRDGKAAEASAVIAMINDELEDESAGAEEEGGATRLDSSVVTRIVVWTAAFQMIRDYPLGIGFGVFPWYLHLYSNVVQWKATHNIYLKVATEAGLPALLLFLSLLFLFAREGWRVGRLETEDAEIRAFGWGILGYIGTMGLNAMSVDLFFQVDTNGQFWVAAGALLQAPLMLRAAATPSAVEKKPEVAEPAKPLYELVR